ncbi:hydrogenase maturation protease [Streptomyces sannanensis]|uniref:Hydrogenase maturation protease n=1 Tax=Streptomyces sannanensis TaxID=285536 RepID=A0ABP6SLF8_9ACTN
MTEQLSGTTRTVSVGGVLLGRGSRVTVRPRQSADILDLALDGRTAQVTSVEEDYDGRVLVAVALEGDPGRELGTGAQIGHRFYFTPEELEPLAASAATARPKVLVAGIGNVFLGDDAFGPEVAAALLRRPQPDEVHVTDFGIRGMDLAYALTDGYDAAVLIDAAPRGGAPGTLYVIEPDVPDDAAPEAHGMDPVRVLALARRLGGEPPRTLVIGCEPGAVPTGDSPDLTAGLSESVRPAVDSAVALVEETVAELIDELRQKENTP